MQDQQGTGGESALASPAALGYNVVIITRNHSITGTVDLGDHRLSDILNDTSRATLRMRGAKVARLIKPSECIEENGAAIVSKDQITLAFEPVPRQQTTKRLYGYVRKVPHSVFMVFDGIEVHGQIHTTGGLELEDIQRFIALQQDKFLAVTQAVVAFAGQERFVIKQGAVIVNVARMNYLAKC